MFMVVCFSTVLLNYIIYSRFFAHFQYACLHILYLSLFFPFSLSLSSSRSISSALAVYVSVALWLWFGLFVGVLCMFFGFAVVSIHKYHAMRCVCVCFTEVSMRACVFSWYIPLMKHFFAMYLASIHIHLSSLQTISNPHYFLCSFPPFGLVYIYLISICIIGIVKHYNALSMNGITRSAEGCGNGDSGGGGRGSGDGAAIIIFRSFVFITFYLFEIALAGFYWHFGLLCYLPALRNAFFCKRTHNISVYFIVDFMYDPIRCRFCYFVHSLTSLACFNQFILIALCLHSLPLSLGYSDSSTLRPMMRMGVVCFSAFFSLIRIANMWNAWAKHMSIWAATTLAE